MSIEHFTLKQKHTFFSAPHCTFSKIDYILSHKTDLSRYKKFDIIPYTLSYRHGLIMVFHNNKSNRKFTYTWKLNNTLLNNNLVREDRKKEISDFLELSENKGTIYPNIWDTMKALLRGKIISLPPTNHWKLL